MLLTQPWRVGHGFATWCAQKSSSAGAPSYCARSRAAAAWPPWVSAHLHSKNVAAPSLSQMSLHDSTDTESPNHWCASSWTTVGTSRLAGEYVGRVWFSSANPGSRPVARPPTVENG